MHSSAELNRLSFVISITRKKISLVYRFWANHVTDLDKKKKKKLSLNIRKYTTR